MKNFTDQMKSSFTISYIQQDENIRKISHRVKEAIDRGITYRNIPRTTELADLILTDEIIRIEDTSGYALSKEEKDYILNILRKKEYIEREEEQSRVISQISEIKKDILDGVYDENAQIKSVGLVLERFVLGVKQGHSPDYMLFISKIYKNPVIEKDITETKEGTVCGREYIFINSHINTVDEFKAFLKSMSNWMDAIFYKRLGTSIINASSFCDSKTNPFRLNFLYTQKSVENAEDSELIIDYGMRLVCRNSSAIQKMEEDFKEQIKLRPGTSYTIDGASFNIAEKDLRIILTLIAHRKKISSETDLYCYMTNVFRYISNNWDRVRIDQNYLIRAVRDKHSTLLKRARKNYFKMQKMKDKDVKNSIELTERIGMEPKYSTKAKKLKEEKDRNARGSIEVIFEFKRSLDYYKALEIYKRKEKEIHLLNKHQKIYIEKYLKREFIVPPYEERKSWLVKHKITILLSLIIILIFYSVIATRIIYDNESKAGKKGKG